MFEIDRWALARAAQFQAEVLAHYEVYEFHPVVAKLQVFCSEDLGAFYLDVLKDRLYTTAPEVAGRRSAQTALWQITAGDAALDGALPQLHRRGSLEGVRAGRLAFDLHRDLLEVRRARRGAARASGRIREIRDVANKEIEAVRTAGGRFSLQANLTITAPGRPRLLPRWARTCASSPSHRR